MAVIYFDSSAFVQLLVNEDGSELAAELWDGCDAALASRLAYPEVRAALASAGRSHRLTAEAQLWAETVWEDFWAATWIVEFTESIARQAGDRSSCPPWRRCCAPRQRHRRRCAGCLFAAWDNRLRAGAASVGLQLVP